MANDLHSGDHSIVLAENEAAAAEGSGGGVRLTTVVDEALFEIVGEDGGVPKSRQLAEPEADRVAPEALERAAQAANALPRGAAERHRAVVLDRPQPGAFRVGLVEDWNVDARRAVARALGTTTQLVAFERLTEGQFARLLAHAYGHQTAQEAAVIARAREKREWKMPQADAPGATAADIERGSVSFVGQARLAAVTRQSVIDLSNSDELAALALRPLETLPVQDFVRLSLFYFINARASDYFLEAGRGAGGCIRYLIDDVPHDKFTHIPLETVSRIGRSLADMADIDGSEMKRRPLNAIITVVVRRPSGRVEEVELRFASMPSRPLPEVTLRSQSEVITDINKLGLLKPHYAQVRAGFSMTQGMFLVTGPTGSGKTNSLNAYLEELGGQRNRRIISMEDPIEVYSDTRSQMPITKTNSWETAFYAMLRSAPKICVVGELRNRQSIAVALEAATTGHLVFATFHTSDVATTFTRLRKAGILPEQLADSLVCVQAQRLVRTLCKCKVVDEVESAAHGRPLYMPKGCSACFGIGYKGRTSLPEILLVNEDVREWVAEGMAGKEVVARAHALGGMILMEEVARLKVMAGMTDFAEVDRVAKFAAAKAREQGRSWPYDESRAQAPPPVSPDARPSPAAPDDSHEDAIDAEYWGEADASSEDEPLDLS